MRALVHFAFSSLRAGLALTVVVGLSVPTARAQVCNDNYTWLITQAEVDAFNCAEVTGTLAVGHFEYGTSDNITNLDGLAELTTVGENLFIVGNTALPSVAGLAGLTSVGRVLRLLNNGALTSLAGLENLTSVGWFLQVQGNNALIDLGGLEGITSTEIFIAFNDALQNLDGLGSITSAGRITISDNGALTDLSSLAGITSVENVTISNNGALQNLDGLGGIISVSGNLSIDNNNALIDLDGLGGITSSIGGNLRIENNGALTDLSSLTGITSVGRSLQISNNDALTDLTGLSGIASVRDLAILDNGTLTSLDGLDNLSVVGFDLGVTGNGSLSNVDALAALSSIGERLLVYGNTNLAECTVGLGKVLSSGGVDLGLVDIRDNLPGCNSKWEAMGGAVNAEDEATPLVTALAAPYPNPTAGAATLSYTLAEPADVRLTVYDALGRRVAVLAEGIRPAGEHEAAFGAGLPAGTYVVRFEAGGEAWSERVTLVR